MINISKDVEQMLQTEDGRQWLIALKLCELVELMKKQNKINVTQTQVQVQEPSLWERVFGCKGNE